MAIDFRNLFFFGDSLTDPGRLPQPFRPDPPYVGGSFSDGPVYAEILPRELGVRAVNFAFGGAEAADPSDPAQFLIGLSAQVRTFEARYAVSGVPAASAASIFFGANDYFNADAGDTGIVNDVIEAIDDAAVRLAQAGVDRLILYNLPNISSTPRGRALPVGERADADDLIRSHNADLRSLSAAYDDAGVPTTIVDVNRLTREIAADRETFGLKVIDTPIYISDGTDEPVATGVTSRADRDEIAFFDSIHPTTASHGILAAFSEATLRAAAVSFGSSMGTVIRGVVKPDFIAAGLGNDKVLALGGNDVVLAGRGDDAVYGGTGNDLVSGGLGNDLLGGSAGSDLLAGNAGNDLIGGGDGNDVIHLGQGLDRASGNDGNDLLIVTDDALTGFDRVYGGDGRDTLRIDVSAAVFASQAFQDEIRGFEPGEVLILRTIGLSARDVERLEVTVDGTRKFAPGGATIDQGPVVAALLHDADLWGLI